MHTLWLLCVILGGDASPTLARPVERIWDQAKHNAFTDLVRYQDRWYCVCREATGHAAGAGVIRVLSSKDGRAWQSLASVAESDVDLRDPHLSVTPDGWLMLIGGAAVPPTRDPVKDHYSWVSFSKDGSQWTRPKRTLESWQWLWRVTWHKGVAYGVAYSFDSKDTARKYHAALYKSPDGLQYDKITDFAVPQATEATLAFDGDVMHCLQRRDGKPNSAMLGRSPPPYTEWTWRDLGMYFGGPNFLKIADGKTADGAWWACGRRMEDGKPQTVVARLDLQAAKLVPALTLPSGGDTSYPGLVWHDGQLWISYYSSHEGKSAIYLARVQLK